MIFQGISHDPFQNDVEEGGGPVSYAAIEDDCTGGLVIKVFNDSDKMKANFVLSHGRPWGHCVSEKCRSPTGRVKPRF